MGERSERSKVRSATNLNVIISAAVRAGNRAHAAAAVQHDIHNPEGNAWVALPVDALHKPLIDALVERNVGRFHPEPCDWHIEPIDFLRHYEDVVASMTISRIGCLAFAGALREAGFAPSVRTMETIWSDENTASSIGEAIAAMFEDDVHLGPAQ